MLGIGEDEEAVLIKVAQPYRLMRHKRTGHVFPVVVAEHNGVTQRLSPNFAIGEDVAS